MGTADSFPQPSPENRESVHGIHRSSTADPPPAHTARKARATDGGQDIHNLVQHYYCCLYSKKKNTRTTVHKEVLHSPLDGTRDRKAHGRER